MQVAMLGALEVRGGSGDVLPVGGSRLRALLIMLALRPGQVVPASELIDGLWAGQAPNGGRQRAPGPGLPPAPGRRYGP